MKSHIELMQPNTFYHVYDRGINGEDVFKEERNYAYFLGKYIENVAETYTYCLLKNHFHFFIRTKSEEEIIAKFPLKNGKRGESDVSDLALTSVCPASLRISQQFANLSNGYAQGINKVYKRRGRLFEELFRRKPISNDSYFSWIIFYIHANPQIHRLVKNFRNCSHSSYKSFLSHDAT